MICTHGNANDESGNGNHGTVHGATLTTDRFGNVNSAYFFSGSQNYIGATALAPQYITVSTWVKPASLGDHNAVAGQGGDWKDTWSLCTSWNYNNKFTAQVHLNHQWYRVTDSSIMATNSWVHLAMTFDGSLLKAYKNGVLIGQITTPAQPLSSDTPPLAIGDAGVAGSQFYSGAIDEVRIYDRALSASEIQQLYSGITNPVTLTVEPTSVTMNVGETTTVNIFPDSGCYPIGSAGCSNITTSRNSFVVTSSHPSVVTATLDGPIITAYWLNISGVSAGSANINLTYSPTQNGIPMGTATVDIPVTVMGGNSGGGTGCASFNLFTSTLHIPCFNPGSPPTYWIDLMLHPSNGIAFSLVNFGENTTSIANNNATFNLFNGKLHVPCLDFGALPTYWLDLGLSSQGDQLLFNLDNFGQN